MPRIFIDAEVFQALADRARAWRDSPNDVLRALLDLPALTPETTAEHLPGQLGPLIRAGLIKPGDQITWYRRNSGRTHTFTVTETGFLADADGSEHIGPDRAATRAAGHPAKGWHVFKTADGAALADLAASLTKNPAQEP